MAEPKESDDEIVKLNSTPPEEDEHGAATRIGEDAYARLARGMLSSPEVPRPDEPPRSFSSRRPGAPPPVPSKPPSSVSRVPPPASSKAPPAGSKAPPPVLPKLGDADLEDASSEGGTMLMPQAAQMQLLGHGSQAPAAEPPPQKSAARPAFPFPPPPPISEPPPPRAIRADIVVAVGVFFVIVVAALIFLYFRELMKH